MPWRLIFRIFACLLLLQIAIAAGKCGIALRHAIWNNSIELRFHGDIDNGFKWGKRANELGYLNVYDEYGTPQRGGDYIDYGPLRLGVMTSWVGWLHRQSGLGGRPDDGEASHAPLLWLNTSMEIATALSACLLTAHVIRRDALRRPIAGAKPPLLPAGVLAGFLASLLVWFNPIILLDAHLWPQWDIWPMPFFLLALYCGLRRWWLLAGFIIGVGSLLKGQIFMAAWPLPIWAVCTGDWRGALRLLFGTLCSVMIGGSPWLLTTYLPGVRGFQHAIELSLPIRRLNWPAAIWVGSWLIAALLLSRKFSITTICVALGTSLLSTVWLFNGSIHWFESGYLFGTYQYPEMYMGPTSNLPAILKDAFHYDDPKYLCFTLHPWQWLAHLSGAAEWPVTMRTLLLTIFAILCVFSAICAGRLDRRRDPRVLLALSLPWLLFFTLPPQIHERYLLFFSTCAATFIAVNWGYVLLGGAVSLVGLCTVVHQILGVARVPRGNPDGQWQLYPTLHAIVGGTHPGIAWLLLLAAAVFLYSIVPPRAIKRETD